MADRIWVRSLIGTPDRLAVSASLLLPAVLAALRNPDRPRASNRLSRQVCSATKETANEFTRCLATSPGFLRHVARDRTVARPTLQRRRTAPPPPVRPAHRAHAGICRWTRRPPRPGTDRAHLPGDGPVPRLRHPGRLRR